MLSALSYLLTFYAILSFFVYFLLSIKHDTIAEAEIINLHKEAESKETESKETESKESETNESDEIYLGYGYRKNDL